MTIENIVVLNFQNVMTARDKASSKINMQNRHSASVVIPLCGSIRFTQGDSIFIADANHPIFLPKGASYINECQSDSDSLMFTFQTLHNYDSLYILPRIEPEEALDYYNKIYKLLQSASCGYSQAALSLIYALLYKFISAVPHENEAERLLMPVFGYIEENYHRPTLSCEELARAAHISEVYLRKLFLRQRGITPFKYLTDVRMEKAKSLVLEKRPICEIAQKAGYCDVYQFSRAYKKHFGFCPTKTNRA